MAADAAYHGGGYRADGAARWPALALSIAIPAALLAALMFLHTVSVARKQQQDMMTFDVVMRAPPPAPAPVPPEQTIAPVVPPSAEIVAPPPVVPVTAPPRQEVATTPTIAPVEPTPTRAPAPAAAPAPPAPAGPLSVGNLTSKLISGTPPSYPVEARRKRETGTVVLRLVLSPEGRIASIVVHRSSGVDVLDKAALDAVRKWRWSPTLRNGEPTEVTGLVQIPFVLKTG
ncbi:MAG: energy transducer TonB [Pseudomonadota bacterium]